VLIIFDGDDLSGASHILTPVVITTSVILISNKIKNKDILLSANRGPNEKNGC